MTVSHSENLSGRSIAGGFDGMLTNLVDVHCHIMPGVDDGSPDEETSLRMLRREAQEGIRKIILTPHQKPGVQCVSPEGTYRRLAALQAMADEEELPLTLYPGSELFYRQGAEELIARGEIVTLCDSDYILVEFYPDQDYPYIRRAFDTILGEGFYPVLAHIERFPEVFAQEEHMDELAAMGVVFQMNAGSVTGLYGRGTKHLCRRLLKQRRISLIGTDAHRAEGSRSPAMQDCARWIERHCGREYALAVTSENADYIIRNELFPAIQ